MLGLRSRLAGVDIHSNGLECVEVHECRYFEHVDHAKWFSWSGLME